MNKQSYLDNLIPLLQQEFRGSKALAEQVAVKAWELHQSTNIEQRSPALTSSNSNSGSQSHRWACISDPQKLIQELVRAGHNNGEMKHTWNKYVGEARFVFQDSQLERFKL